MLSPDAVILSLIFSFLSLCVEAVFLFMDALPWSCILGCVTIFFSCPTYLHHFLFYCVLPLPFVSLPYTYIFFYFPCLPFILSHSHILITHIFPLIPLPFTSFPILIIFYILSLPTFSYLPSFIFTFYFSPHSPYFCIFFFFFIFLYSSCFLSFTSSCLSSLLSLINFVSADLWWLQQH